MLNVQNRLKNSKIDKIVWNRVKSVKSNEIIKNPDFGSDFTISTKTYTAL